MILQLRHATFITQSLKEIHSGRETGLIDTGPLYILVENTSKYCSRIIVVHVHAIVFFLKFIQCVILF